MEKYVLVHNGNVVLGPFQWSYTRFQNVIFEDYGLEVQLPREMTPDTPYLVNQDKNLWIYTARPGENIPHNPRIEIHHGPFWNFNSRYAEYYYRPERMHLDAAKNLLLQELAAERYRREVAGTKVVVGAGEVNVDTSRDGRATFIQRYTVMGAGEVVDWKFPTGWIALTKEELGQIVAAAAAHVQACFDWERTTAEQINQCITHEQLLDITVVEPAAAPNLTDIMLRSNSG